MTIHYVDHRGRAPDNLSPEPPRLAAGHHGSHQCLLRTPWPTDDPGLTRAERRQLLLANGYNIGEADRKIGPITRAAIADVERRFGMPPTGRAGQKIYRALGGR